MDSARRVIRSQCEPLSVISVRVILEESSHRTNAIFRTQLDPFFTAPSNWTPTASPLFGRFPEQSRLSWWTSAYADEDNNRAAQTAVREEVQDPRTCVQSSRKDAGHLGGKDTVTCKRMVQQVFNIFRFQSENWSWSGAIMDQIEGWVVTKALKKL